MLKHVTYSLFFKTLIVRRFWILPKVLPVSIEMIACFCTCICPCADTFVEFCTLNHPCLPGMTPGVMVSFCLLLALPSVSRGLWRRLVYVLIRRTGLWFSSVLAVVASNTKSSVPGDAGLAVWFQNAPSFLFDGRVWASLSALQKFVEPVNESFQSFTFLSLEGWAQRLLITASSLFFVMDLFQSVAWAFRLSQM